MQISTPYDESLLTGIVRVHSAYFIEVEITSPYAKLITSRSIPSYARSHRRLEGRELENCCRELLIELYRMAHSQTAKAS